MPVVVCGCPSDAIALLDGKCWQQSLCAHTSGLRGEQFTLRTDHSSLRWLQRFRNGDGMLARWYLLLGQFSVTFEYRPGHSMPTQTACRDNVVSVNDQTVRRRQKIRRRRRIIKKWRWWISRSQCRKWGSLLTEEFTAQRQHVGSGAGVDSAEFHSDMDRLCWNVSGIALLEATDREFVHRSGWPVMAKTSTTGGGFSTDGTI